MKAIQLTTLILSVSVVSGTLLAQTTTPLEFWEFNDAGGTDLQTAANSGSIATAWDLPTDIKGDVTSGSALILSGDSGVYARRTDPPYSPPLPATGSYILEMAVDGWTIDSTTLANNSYFRFVAGDSVMRFDLAELQFRYQEVDVEGVATPTVKLQYRVNTGDGFTLVTVAEYTDMAVSTPVSWAVLLDYDNGLAQGYLDGVAVGEPSPFGPPDQIHGIVFGKAGPGSWASPGTSLAIDYMGLSETDAEVTNTWYGYEIVDGLVDTGEWLGWVFVSNDPWIYHYDLESWVYFPAQDTPGGAWMHIGN